SAVVVGLISDPIRPSLQALLLELAVTETESRPRNRALVASFLFTDLVGYSKGTASEQYAAKAALSDILGRNLAALGKDDYRIKDTGDGCLIAFLVNPEHALYMALAIAHDFARAASAAGFPSNNVRTGLHIGAVKEAIDLEARPNFVGDGINAAQRIMDFAAPGQITASRAYFEAVSWLDSAYAALFQHLGASNDKHGRPHELYAVTPNDAVLEKLRLDLGSPAQQASETDKATVASPAKQTDRSPTAVDASSSAPNPKPVGERRWVVPVAAVAGVAILAALGYVAMAPNPSGMTSRSADGKSSAAAASTSSAAQPAAPTPSGRAADAKEPETAAQPTQEAKPSVTSAPPASEARSSPPPALEGKSSAPLVGAKESTPSSGAKPDAATAMRGASDANPLPASPARTTTQSRPNATNANAETQRKSAEPPSVPVAASASAPPGTPAATSASAPASARCRHILEKVQVGEPLSQDEKRELASSCR
ncbi:MAG TPA: hypothetical protein VFJ48_04310, partial [Casimicrobiaceae bacterium]|nr:hypothetical protein [Casimicrobiaceae bacterium]